MVRTFYIPKEKADVMKDFKKNAKKSKVSYSRILVEFMENYNKNYDNEKR